MKRNLLLLISFLVLSFNFSSAQIIFQKNYGTANKDILADLQITADSGYVMAGYTNGAGAGSYDGYVIKTDKYGDTLWTRTYGCEGDDELSSVKQTFDKGYILSGYTTSFGGGDQDIFLIKTDSMGVPVWIKTYGGSENDAGGEVRQTSDSGYIVVGTTDSLNASDTLFRGITVIKTKPNGDTLWTRTYNGANMNTVDGGSSICPTHDGGYIVGGSAVQQDSTNADVYLLKIDSAGNFMWDTFIGGPGNDNGGAVHQTTDRGYIISGTTTGFGNGGDDYYLVKTDSMGVIQWTKTYGGGNTDEGGYSDQIAGGGYFMIGSAGSYGVGLKSFFLIKTDANGDTVWAKAYSAPSTIKIGITGKQTADGGFILAGWHEGFPLNGLDFYLMKIDANGNSGLTEQDENGVETTPVSSQMSLPVAEAPGTIVTNIPIPNTGSAADHNYCPVPLGINTVDESNAFVLYPNPAGNELNIKGELRSKNAELRIVNILGQTVLQSSVFNLQSSINVSSLLSGLYFVRLSSAEQTWTGKFVKE